MVLISEIVMKKKNFLLFVAVLALFIAACSEDEEGIFAGAACSSEGAETCSDDGANVLLCQSSVWALKYQCNVSIGKRCKLLSDNTFACAGDEIQYDDDGDDPEIAEDDEIVDDTETVDDPDTVPDTENPDPETPVSDDNDEPASDFDTTEPGDDDTGETPDPDTTETQDPDISEPDDDDEIPDQDQIPEGSCNSNADCSGATPYCSISTSKCIANAVFITEYVEGSGYNKAIEIYNGSKSSVNLSNFTIQQANNGKDWGTTNYVYSFPDSAQLNSGAVYVICKSEFTNKCNATVSTGATFDFNGDDGMALFEGSSIVDQLGGDPANYEYWSVAGVPSAMVDHTLRRKAEIIQGTTDWAASAGTSEADSQWIVLDQDTFDGLGSR